LVGWLVGWLTSHHYSRRYWRTLWNPPSLGRFFVVFRVFTQAA